MVFFISVVLWFYIRRLSFSVVLKGTSDSALATNGLENFEVEGGKVRVLW